MLTMTETYHVRVTPPSPGRFCDWCENRPVSGNNSHIGCVVTVELTVRGMILASMTVGETCATQNLTRIEKELVERVEKWSGQKLTPVKSQVSVVVGFSRSGKPQFAKQELFKGRRI